MKRTIQGLVVANKTDKTVTVQVESSKTHPLYKKNYTVSKKYAVHDEENKAQVDDIVLITESKPISKRKRWVLTEITGKAGLKHTEPDPTEAEQ